MTKEQVLKLIESKINTCQQLAIESIELIYNAGYNEGVENAIEKAGICIGNEYNLATHVKMEIRKLKK